MSKKKENEPENFKSFHQSIEYLKTPAMKWSLSKFIFNLQPKQQINSALICSSKLLMSDNLKKNKKIVQDNKTFSPKHENDSNAIFSKQINPWTFT